MADVERDQAATEGEHPRARDLDLLPTSELLQAMHEEDRRVPGAVGRVLPELARAVDHTAGSLLRGGRLLLFGAGTSGRLAMMEAAECPPTFGVPPELVQGLMAGGPQAFQRAVEGAEDDRDAGAASLAGCGPRRNDVVAAVTAGGGTPWCLGVLREARRLGLFTLAVTCNPRGPAARAADLVVAPEVGPELLAGSTRLKAGSAQKLVLNMLTTAVMVRLGRTHGGLMVGLAASNEKLRLRAVRLVGRITGRAEEAREALQRCGWDVRRACVVLARGVDPDQAASLLEAAGGSLRRALEP